METRDPAMTADDANRTAEPEEFSFNMFPELLACVREGDAIALREQLQQTDFCTYYHEAVQGWTTIRPSFLVQVGFVLATACQGGLSLDRGTVVCSKYLRESATLDSVEDFLDCTRRMLAEFTDEVQASPRFASGNATVDRCLTYIHEHVYEKIDLPAVAAACGYSLDWLQHLFHCHTGETLSDAVRRAKTDKAKFYLRHTELSGTAIAQKLAYCSQSYFISQFRRETGLTPAAYRRQNRHTTHH